MALMCVLALAGACDNLSGGDTSVKVTGVVIDQTDPSVAVGDTIELTATVSPADATDKKLTWSSSAPAIAEVSNAGVVTGKAAGKAEVTAKSADGPSGKVEVTVTASVPITGLTLDKTTLNLNKGASGALVPVFKPADTTDTGLTWSSSDPAVATVSGGTVTAVGGGTATITATSTANNSISAVATVTVTVPLTGISLSPNPLEVGTERTGALTVNYDPPDTTQRGISWSSSNPAVATVSGGTVTAVAVGTATITAASTVDRAKTANATVNVIQTIPITALALDATTLDLTKGASGALAPVFTPADTTDTGVTWTSSNTAVATVSGGTVTAVGGGTAIITAASTADNSITVTATVTVTVPLTGISLSPNLLELGAGATGALTVNYDPPDTTDTGVTWTSSNTAVATVSGGTVAAVGGGTAVITATSTADSAITATATVNVIIPLAGLSLSPASLILRAGGRPVTLTVTYVPLNTTQTGVTWSSSDTAVATVSDGVVTAVAEGTATITVASTVDSAKIATATVTVSTIVPVTGISIPSGLTLGVGSAYSLPVNYDPPDTTQRGVSWSSSDAGVATVNAATGEITAVATGTATITAASTADPDITDDCALTVQTSFSGVGLNIVFEGLEDETVTLDVTVSQGDQFVITAPSGFARYLWYFDGDSMDSENTETVIYPVGRVTIGRHYITVIVERGGKHFSKTLAYTVGY
jgi:uncharacterized protein YjdB